MKLFIAATSSMRKRPDIVRQSKYLLELFYTIADWQMPLIHEADMFLLDSGAFTFMGSKKGQKIDFDKYLDDYIEFINKYDVKYFFELDIDSVVGYPKVLEMRKKLERETGKSAFPYGINPEELKSGKGCAKTTNILPLEDLRSRI